jgi:6-phosphofructokinase 2
MTKVVTLTPNPALDISAHVEKLVPSHKLRCSFVRRDPGGGGINVARTIRVLGGDAMAVYARGGACGDELEELLRREGVRQLPVPVSGRTRESFNVTEDQSGKQFRFILPGDSLSESDWRACTDRAVSLLTSGDYFVGSGSLPVGVPPSFYAEAAQFARGKGAITAIDTQGPSLKAVLGEGLDILKVSAREFAEYLGTTPDSPSGWRDACRDLLHAGKAKMIAVTLGEKGAMLATPSRAWHVAVPKVRELTTVGAGDSFLGGLLVKLMAEKALPEALRFACAAGTAALLSHGTGLCNLADVEKLSSSLTSQEL